MTAPVRMWGVVTTGNGGYDRLEYRYLSKPAAKLGKTLIRVLAEGISKTEMNTRLVWYSSSTRPATAFRVKT